MHDRTGRHPLPDLHEANPEIAAGLRIVERALGEPLRRIALNVAEEAQAVLEQVQAGEGSDGFNANSRAYGDLIAMGVIEPANNAARAPAMSPEF